MRKHRTLFGFTFFLLFVFGVAVTFHTGVWGGKTATANSFNPPATIGTSVATTPATIADLGTGIVVNKMKETKVLTAGVVADKRILQATSPLAPHPGTISAHAISLGPVSSSGIGFVAKHSETSLTPPISAGTIAHPHLSVTNTAGIPGTHVFAPRL